MKSLFLITLLMYYCCSAAGQILDSISIKKITTNGWQEIRKIDSLCYTKYVAKSPFFKHKYQNGSVYIRIPYKDSLPKYLFIGELTTNDSIRFIDFVEVNLNYIRMCIEGISSTVISRNQLPQIEKFTVYTNSSSIKLLEFDLFISHGSSFLEFKKIGPTIPLKIRKAIMALKENEYIITDNVKVIGPDGSKRTIQGISLIIRN